MLLLMSLSAWASGITIDEDVLDQLLAKQITCNDLVVTFNDYKLKATKRIDDCSDTLRLNKQIVAEAQSVLHKQGHELDKTVNQLILTRHELSLRKKQEPVKMAVAFGAGTVAGAVAVIVLAATLN